MNSITWLELTVYGLACFRLAVLVSEDSGPFKMFTRFRSLIRRESQEKENKILRKSDFKKGIQCVRCETVIFGLFIAPYAYFHDQLPQWLATTGDIFLLAMALSALGILFNRAFPKR